MDRTWYSPATSGLCLSLAFTFRSMPEHFPSLSLAIGIGVAQALERFGIQGIPTLILFKNGEPVERLVGAMPKEQLLSQLRPHLSQD